MTVNFRLHSDPSVSLFISYSFNLFPLFYFISGSTLDHPQLYSFELDSPVHSINFRGLRLNRTSNRSATVYKPFVTRSISIVRISS
jgi:hypothetical protein